MAKVFDTSFLTRPVLHPSVGEFSPVDDLLKYGGINPYIYGSANHKFAMITLGWSIFFGCLVIISVCFIVSWSLKRQSPQQSTT